MRSCMFMRLPKKVVWVMWVSSFTRFVLSYIASKKNIGVPAPFFLLSFEPKDLSRSICSGVKSAGSASGAS